MSSHAARWTAGGLALAALLVVTQDARSAGSRIIEPTQMGCQYRGSENGDRGFEPQSAEPCDQLDAEAGSERPAEAEVLKLEPGTCTFRVSHAEVPYEHGFWIRQADCQLGKPVHKLTETSVSGGAVFTGQTKDYELELERGEYVYSCPLDPIAGYKLGIEG